MNNHSTAGLYKFTTSKNYKGNNPGNDAIQRLPVGITHKSGYLVDRRRNRVTLLGYTYGDIRAAITKLQSLIDCHDCLNCDNCTSCSHCEDCSKCTNCHKCERCRECHKCRKCVKCWASFNCENCQDCRSCYGCHDCVSCKFCTDCEDCKDCKACYKISGCNFGTHLDTVENVEFAVVVGPTRSDGYQFAMSASGSVHAGCRIFANMAVAREHWERTRSLTPLGEETTRILDYMEVAFSKIDQLVHTARVSNAAKEWLARQTENSEAEDDDVEDGDE